MTLDMNTLYKDLLKSYATSIKREQYEKDAHKVAEVLHKNPSLVDVFYTQSKTNQDNKTRFVSYPDYNNASFNQKIYNKIEFNRAYQDTASASSYKDTDFDDLSKARCSQTEFKLTANQKFIKNFLSPLTPYNGILLFHSVGVGKTCTAISIAEQYHQLYQKPVLVILSSALIDNFKKQIFDITKYDITTNQSNLCTGTAYPDLILDKQLMKIDVLEKNINKIINQRYKFMGYKKLVSIFNQTMERVKRQEKDTNKHDKLFYDKIKEYFSDRLIIIDEAHNLRNSSETGKKQISQTFWNLLKHTENVKMVLLTATPMYNSVSEIVWFLNLLLTNDKRPNIKMTDLFDKMGALTGQGKRKLIETARGYVSYMRGENPFSFPFRLYPSINGDKNIIKDYPIIDIHNHRIKDEDKVKFLEVIGSQMSNYQKQVYDVYKKRAISSNASWALDDDDDLGKDVDANFNDDDMDDDADDESMANDLQSVIQISNIVYPIDDMRDPMALRKTFGKLGFENTFINTAKKGVRYRYSNQCLSTYGEILRYDKLAAYAPKIKRIIDYIVKSEGIVFIYSNYYPSGIKPLAIALEHIGFLKYNSNNLMVDDITVENKFSGTSKRPSYVILSPKSELSPNNDKEIEMIKSKQNANGDIVKVVIASSIATEGIDFKRIREVHILQPWYNLNRSEQVIGRAVRTCSHIDLPKEKRNVTIYFHASTYDAKQESIDLRTYRLAEKKQKKITEVERIIKETSIDCNLNKELLTYDVKRLNMTIPLRTSQGTVIDKYAVGDRDYSYVCNYAKCELKCNPDLHEQYVDDSTYDTRFIMDDVSLYKRYIGQLYSQDKRKAFTYETVLRKLTTIYKAIDEEVLQYALQDMLDDKTPVYDIDNIRGYLIYRSNKYIFQTLVAIDKRMTLEQREAPTEVKNRVKLDVSILKAKLVKGRSTTSSSPRNGNANGKDGQKRSTDVAHNNVLEYVAEQYNAIKSGFVDAGLNLDRYDKYIIDSLVDRLTPLDYKKLIEELADIYNKRVKVNDTVIGGCLRSLLEAGVLMFDDETDTLKYFYNYFDGDMYCLRNDKEFKKCSPLDTNKISKKVSELMHKMNTPMEDSVKGHIETSAKNGACDFKVRDNPKSFGYVCWKTSSLSLGDLKERIKVVDKALVIDTLVKKDLCYLYELVLRLQGKKVFKRAITKNLK